MQNIFNKVLSTSVTAALALISICVTAQADSYGIKFLGNTTDMVTNAAGVVPIANWTNIANTTFSSGTILSSDGSKSATLTLSGHGANGWHSGTAADGGNSSLLDGYMDIGNSGSGTITIGGLTGPSYTVYLYTEGDSVRPSNGGDWLPNYAVNGSTNYTATVTGAFSGFTPGGIGTANNNTYPTTLAYGNYIKIQNVAPVGGVITIVAGPDTRTWRSPLNAIEIIPTETWGIKFLGNTTDMVTNAAGVVPIANWTNVDNTTFSSGTIQSSDGSESATLSLSGPDSADGWHSGTAADGGNSSLLDGYMDVQNVASAATITISGLTQPSYAVYVYTEADTARPGNGGDWLPNYEVNGDTNFAATVGGAFTGFIESGTTTRNNNTYPTSLQYGNYVEFENVVPVSGVITIVAEPDGRTWRSPLNAIEIVAAAAYHPIAIVTQPSGQRAVTNTPATFSVTATGTSIAYQWFQIASGATNLLPNATNMSYTTGPVEDSSTGNGYYVVLTNALGSVTSAVATVTAGHIIGPVPGFLEADEFDDDFPTGLSALTVLYPDSPWLETNSPTSVEYLPSFNDNADLANNTGERIFGWFTPTVTGNYVFYVASDDESVLWLSTNNSPANAFEIAQVQAWMYAEDWTLTQTSSAEYSGGYVSSGEWRSDQFELNGGPSAFQSAISGSWNPWPGLNSDGSISLSAGNPYYIELDHWQGGGGQCAAVTYKLAGQTDPVYQSAPQLGGGNLSTMQALDGAAITISGQPTNMAAQQNSSAIFSVAATTSVLGAPGASKPGLEYQWQAAPSGSSTFTNIAGATTSAYATPPLTIGDSGSQFRVILTTLNAQTTSSVATVTVEADTTQPAISEIGASAETVSITWNKLLDPASAVALTNYSINGGITIESATMTNVVSGAYAAASVQLAISGATVGSNYTLTVNHVKDLSEVQTVSPNTKVSFAVDDVFLDFNEGSASIPGAVVSLSGLANFNVNSGVNDGGAVSLTIPSGGLGQLVVNDPLAGATVNSFLTTFKLLLAPFPNNNVGAAFGNGFSISFGSSSSVFPGAADNGSGGINAGGVVSVGFITTSGANAVDVLYGGVAVTNVTVPGSSLVSDQWSDVTIQLTDDGTVTVVLNGTVYVRDLALPGYSPVAGGAFLFGASSGLNWNEAIVDDISITENAAPPPATISISTAGATLMITWTPAGGHLQTTHALGSGWTDVAASQPAIVPITATNSFFRVVVP